MQDPIERAAKGMGIFFLALSTGHKNWKGNSHFFFLLRLIPYNVGNLNVNI